MEYLLYEIREKEGKLNGSTIWTLGFISLETGEEYACVVDSSYRNYTRNNWCELLHTSTPYGIYTGMKRDNRSTGKKGEKILHGDSKPVQIDAYTQEEAERAYKVVKQHFTPKVKPVEFGGGLFTFE